MQVDRVLLMHYTYFSQDLLILGSRLRHQANAYG